MKPTKIHAMQKKVVNRNRSRAGLIEENEILKARIKDVIESLDQLKGFLEEAVSYEWCECNICRENKVTHRKTKKHR
jgi:hypothetical protein